ncbi:MAG TPA: M28 family peptidase [Planctomycetota bacterium]|nr:M28 family peptidase [Planctomycetota bacterium]
MPAALLLLLAGLPACDGCDEAPAAASAPGASHDDSLAAVRDEPITEASLRALLKQLPGRRSLGTPEHLATRAWLLQTLSGWGLHPRLLPFEWAGLPGVPLANIEVRLPGATPDAPLVAVSAHYDSVAWTPGADDNGSGVVVLLELARRLSAGGFPHELRLLWFDAEEPGLLGSGAWVAALSPDDAHRFIGLVNLETMGFTDRAPGTQRLPDGAELVFHPGDKGDFLLCLGNLASAALTAVVGGALAEENSDHFRVETFAWLPGNGLVLPDTRRSDHSQFWDRGLQAVLLTDTANLRSPHYHDASDTLETLDLPFLTSAARGVERATRKLVADDR